MKIKPNIPDLTVICVCGNKHGENISSLYKAKNEIDAAKFVFITNVDIKLDGIECINVGGLDSWDKYNHFLIKETYKYFDTSHCLIVQWDGLVDNGQLWSDDFLKYDYVAALWLDNVCGNGGFSIRSKRLMEIVGTDDNIQTTSPEDIGLCRFYRKYLTEKYNITYAPKEVCDRFSFELNEPMFETFGHHGFHWPKFRETVVVKRSGACGDVIMAEALLHHLHKQGYQVALDTQDQFYGVYSQHYFPVVPKHHLNPKLPYREINLDMAYEIKPKQPVLKSYYEMAGITDGEMRNSRLSLRSGNGQKLFKQKYVLIHLDSTGMPYRDCYGVKWSEVINFLEQEGFLVFQIGNRVQNPICTFLNTMSLEFMMFLVSGADLFIGLDSGVAQVAVAFDIPSVIFFGSVNPQNRYINFEKIRVVQSACPKKETEHCYHNKIDVVGTDCIYNKLLPPCTQYTAQQVIEKINELI